MWKKLVPVLEDFGSDSANLDNALELLTGTSCRVRSVISVLLGLITREV